MSPDETMAAWESGEIDGSFIWHPTLGKMLDDNGIVLGIVLTSAKQLAEEGIITADLAVLKESAEFMVSQGAIEVAPELEIYNDALYTEAVNAASEVAAK